MHALPGHSASGFSLAKLSFVGETGSATGFAAGDVQRSGWPAGLEIIRTEAGFDALQPVWDELLESSHTRTPFLRWDWARLWWRLFGGDYELALIVVKDAFGTPEGIAPLVIGRSSSGARKYLRQICWLGGVGDVEGEVMDFLVPAGREAELTPRLCQGLRLLASSWQGVRLNKIPEDSPNLPILMEQLKSLTVFTGMVNIHASRRTELSSDWEQYAARHSGRWRRNLRKRWETMLGTHGAEPGLAGKDLPAAEAMAQLGALHEDRWREGISTFRQQRAWEFHRQLAEKWIPSGRAVMPFLTVEGRMVAACYGFMEDDHFYHYQVGWDRRYADVSLGNLAVKQCVEFCIGKGVREYEMLSGEYRYKTEWCPEWRRLIDVEGYSSASPAAACFVGLRSLKRLIYPPGSESRYVGATVDVGQG